MHSRAAFDVLVSAPAILTPKDHAKRSVKLENPSCDRLVQICDKTLLRINAPRGPVSDSECAGIAGISPWATCTIGWRRLCCAKANQSQS